MNPLLVHQPSVLAMDCLCISACSSTKRAPNLCIKKPNYVLISSSVPTHTCAVPACVRIVASETSEISTVHHLRHVLNALARLCMRSTCVCLRCCGA